LSQVTTSDRRYDLYFAEDIQSESYSLLDSVARTAETDAVVKAYFDARLNLYTKLQPGRMLPEASLSYRGTESVAEVTTEYTRLYPITQP
jgi:hypothetical protein